MRFGRVMSEEEASQMNALQLAFLGDAVWETMIRYDLTMRKLKVHHLHTESVSRVNAAAQAGMLEMIRDLLNEKETDIVRRGRNAHPRHTVPKNQQPDDYASATGFEALWGYLYLSGQDERIRTLAETIREQERKNG